MKKEITLEEAIRRFQKGEDTIILIPAKDENGNDFYAVRSFLTHLKDLENAMFLIDQKPSPTKGIKRGPRKPKQVPVNEEVIQEELKVKKRKPDIPISKDAKPKKIDIGKLVALRNGKWKIKDIADELNVSQATVNKYLRKIKDGEIDPNGYIEGFDEPETEEEKNESSW